MDSLLLLVMKSGFNCFVGPHFAAALAYVDDWSFLPNGYGYVQFIA
jgi:hypothetical protein